MYVATVPKELRGVSARAWDVTGRTQKTSESKDNSRIGYMTQLFLTAVHRMCSSHVYVRDKHTNSAGLYD